MALDQTKAQSILLAVVEKPPAQRGSFLDQACAGDAKLRRQIEESLAILDPGTVEVEPVSCEQADDPDTQASDLPPRPHSLPPNGKPGTDYPGARIGPYKLLECVGEGGMGTVWLAQQTAPVHRNVALKLIKSGMDSGQFLARFEAERHALALMDHPNIAKVLDAGTTDNGRPFFVMELVKGIPLTDYCDKLMLTPRQRLELFVPVCHAIQHAHQKAIIHRDIKPSNILVTMCDGKAVPKIIDFGVAKAIGQKLTDRTLHTGVRVVVGTLEYMSPEQAEPNQLDVDARTDIYALGVVLYELLTGTTPLTRQRLQTAAFAEVLRMIRDEDPAKPSTRLSESKDNLPGIAARRKLEPAKLTKVVRGELDWVVMKALEKDRGRRYDTANAFAMDILRVLHDEPVLASSPSTLYRLRKFAKRKKGPLTAAALVLLALAGGSVGTSAGLLQAMQQRDVAEANRYRAVKAENVAQKAIEAAANERKAKDREQMALARLTQALERLVQLCEAMGHKEQAAYWRREFEAVNVRGQEGSK